MSKKTALAVAVLLLAISCTVSLWDSEESDAASPGTADNPLSTFEYSPYEIYNEFGRNATVYVRVGGTVDIYAAFVGSYAYWSTGVTNNYGLSLTGPTNYESVTGTISQAGTITVSMTSGNYQIGNNNITIIAVQSSTHTVSFSVSSGSSYGYVSPASITVPNGTTYTTLGSVMTFSDGQMVRGYTNSPPSGYTYSFGSWSSNSGTITADTSITCTFTRQSVTPTYTCYLYYDANGGNANTLPSPNPQTYSGSSTSSHTFTISSQTPTRSGYDFVGWSKSNIATLPSYYPGGSIDVLYNGTTTLYAVWDTLYTYSAVASPVGGGTATVDNASSVQKTSERPLQLRAVPSEGYRFIKWTYTSGGITSDLSTSQNYYVESSPAINTTYTAIFQQYVFPLVLDAGANGGFFEFNPDQQSETTRNVSVSVGSLYSSADGWQNTVYKLGYSFDGWYTAQIGGTLVSYDTTVPQNPPSRLYAQFSPIAYTVSTTPNDQSAGSTSGDGTFYYGDSVTIVAAPYEGNTFIKWTTVSPGGSTVDVSSDSAYTFTLDYNWVMPYTAYTRTFTAIFNNDEITITFDGNGGSPSSQTKVINRGSQIGELPTATRSGTVFSGWSMYLYNTGTMITPTTTFTEDTTVYAMFDVTVTYNPNGGTITQGDATQSVTIGQMDYRLPDATKIGFSLEGWYTAQTGGERVYTSTRTVSSTNHTLYAHWTSNTITVIFDAETNGGTLRGDPTKEVSRGGTFGLLPAATKTDYVFDGWYTNPNTGSKILPSSVVAYNYSDPLTLYAHFTQSTGTEIWWDNGYINSRVDIAFSFESLNDNKTHSMIVPFLKYDGVVENPNNPSSDGIDYFYYSAYSLKIDITYQGSIDTYLRYGETVVETWNFNPGVWTQFVLSIDAQNGTISFAGVSSPYRGSMNSFSFVDYTVLVDKGVIVNFSEYATEYAINRIYHSDSMTGTNHVSFQVVSTETFLNTFGFVMNDPVLNIHDKFPDYNNLRLNLYSFAVFGETITINNHTFVMDKSLISNLYYVQLNRDIVDAGGNVIDHETYYQIADEDTEGAIKGEFTLQNVYITWTNIQQNNDRMCYLTFVDRGMTIEMGSFNPNDLTIMGTGIWYFTTAIYEPYLAHETTFEMDWNSWFNLSANAFILIFMALAIIGLIVLNRFYEVGMIDYMVVIGAGLVSYILLGGF